MLAELRNIQSIEDLPIDMQHLGTVFVLDSDRNGRVTLPELFEFAALCSRKREEFRQHDYPMQVKPHVGDVLQSEDVCLQLQGFCTLRMLDTVLSEGMELFVRWFQALFTEGYEECFLPEYPNVAFVGRDTAHLMHEVDGEVFLLGHNSCRFSTLTMFMGMTCKVSLICCNDQVTVTIGVPTL